MKLLILKEKHGDRYFSYTTQAELHLIARFVVAEHNEEGYYDDEERVKVLANLNRVTLHDDGEAALRVLEARCTYEYEGFELDETETVPGVPA